MLFVDRMNSDQGIGELRDINRFIPVTFEINTKPFKDHIDREIKKIDDLIMSSNEIKSSGRIYNKFKINLQMSKLELENILFGLVEPIDQNSNRQKRDILDGITSEDYLIQEDEQNIKMDLNMMKNTNSVFRVRMANIMIEKKVNAITKLVKNGKLSGEVINVPKFNEKLDEIKKSLNGTEELAFSQIAEYCFYFKAKNIKIEDDQILYSLDVPISDKTKSFKFYKVKVEENDEDSYKQKGKYVLKNDKESFEAGIEVFRNCYRSLSSVFFC